MTTLRIEEAKTLSSEAQRRFGRILVDSFPAEERDAPEEVLNNIAEGRRRCTAAYDGENLVGVAVLCDLKDANAVLLEYLAVDQAIRSRGVGGRLLDGVFAVYAAEPTRFAGMILEVEPPAEASGGERVLRERRIRFYERHGASLVRGAPAYRVPRTTGPGVVPYLLMWRPLADTSLLEGERLRRVVESVLVHEYAFSENDPFVLSVLAELVA